MILVWVFGLCLAWITRAWTQNWFLAKFAIVVALSGYHGWMIDNGGGSRAAGPEVSGKALRLMNKVPGIAVVLIVVLVSSSPLTRPAARRRFPRAERGGLTPADTARWVAPPHAGRHHTGLVSSVTGGERESASMELPRADRGVGGKTRWIAADGHSYHTQKEAHLVAQLGLPPEPPEPPRRSSAGSAHWYMDGDVFDTRREAFHAYYKSKTSYVAKLAKFNSREF